MLAADRRVDRPMADLLSDRVADVDRATMRRQGYLEGFHAADLTRLGTRALAENEAAEDEDGDEPQRVAEGYGALVAGWRAALILPWSRSVSA